MAAHRTHGCRVGLMVLALMGLGMSVVRLMAFDWYKHSSSADLDALVAYLRTLKPAAP